MLTKKDFIRFALALSNIENEMIRKEQTNSQIAILEQTNPQFDAGRFRAYVESHAKSRSEAKGFDEERAKRIKEKYKWVGIK
jgi:hypothetical protein